MNYKAVKTLGDFSLNWDCAIPLTTSPHPRGTQHVRSQLWTPFSA